MSGGGSQSSDDVLRVNVGYPNGACGADLPLFGVGVWEEGKDLIPDKPSESCCDLENVCAIWKLLDVPLE